MIIVVTHADHADEVVAPRRGEAEQPAARDDRGDLRSLRSWRGAGRPSGISSEQIELDGGTSGAVSANNMTVGTASRDRGRRRAPEPVLMTARLNVRTSTVTPAAIAIAAGRGATLPESSSMKPPAKTHTATHGREDTARRVCVRST